MRTGSESGGVLIRPELPAQFVAAKGAVTGIVAGGVVLGAMGVLLLFAALAANKDGGDAAAQIVLGLLGLGAMGLGVFATIRFVRSVTMDDDGLTLRGFYQSRKFAWDHVAEVELGYESKERKQRRSRAVGIGGVLGGAVGGAIAGAFADVEADHRQGDPYENGQLRRHYDPYAVVKGAGGRKLVRLGESFGWALFTALRAEARARGIAVRRKAETGAPRRRRR